MHLKAELLDYVAVRAQLKNLGRPSFDLVKVMFINSCIDDRKGESGV
jgi:hypothetical protein